MLYRIVTERKRLRRIRRICNRLFQGYTMYKAYGAYKGVPEKSVVIEVQSDGLPYAALRVKEAAEEIREVNKQECVLVQSFPCLGVLV